MNLREFIAETLVQIAKGIEDASEQLSESTAIVNPRNVQIHPETAIQAYGYVDTKNTYLKAVQKIEFDVAVTASTGTETKGGIGIMVGSVGLGSQGKSEAENSSLSRIKFLVPMVLPMTSALWDPQDPD